MRSAVLLVAVLVAATLLAAPALAETVVAVGPDGYADVSTIVQVQDAPSTVTVPLLGQPDYIAAYLNGTEPLPVDVSGSEATILVPGPGEVNVTYGTAGLTSKSAGVWTLSIPEAPGPVEVVLPGDAVTITVEGDIVDAYTVGGTPHLVFSAGPIRIEYVRAPPQPTSTFTATQPTEPPTTIPAPTPGPGAGEADSRRIAAALVAFAVAVSLAAALLAKYRASESGTKGGGNPSDLDDRDRAILAALSRLGEATAADIVRETGLPKTPVYRRLRRLEELGYVESRRVAGTVRYRVRSKT